ncbi:signal recognition particle receptor subunit alpha, partial [Herbaspirillum sp.]|uniref:signal recognition particle receptor subunit alpha n=1 Tax=Herbaspirillum sp. TaxID=1890675 RepID=UPI0031DC94C1
MFSFFKRKPKPEVPPEQPASLPPEVPVAPAVSAPIAVSEPVAPPPQPEPAPVAVEPVEEIGEVEQEAEIVAAPQPTPEAKRSWLSRLKSGLSKTSSNLTTLFVGARIDDDLYDELESALLVSDAGVEATQWLLDELKKKVKAERLTEAAQVRTALRSLLIDLLQPLQRPLVLGREQPLVMMIAGVNGAGKTTTIGKLALHLQAHGQSVLLAAGDTFRAA